MDGLAYLLAIVAVGLVILWARTNDRVPLDGETTGLLAMTPPRRTARPAGRGQASAKTPRRRRPPLA